MAKTEKKYYVTKANLLREIKESKARYLNSKKEDKTYAEFMTSGLVEMLESMVDRYSSRLNWSGYTYLSELKGEALVNLIEKWHKFDDNKKDANPFAYYTTVIKHSFIGQLAKEKKPQKIKDAILSDAGMTPSFSQQIDDETEWRKKNADKLIIKRGRKPKPKEKKEN